MCSNNIMFGHKTTKAGKFWGKPARVLADHLHVLMQFNRLLPGTQNTTWGQTLPSNEHVELLSISAAFSYMFLRQSISVSRHLRLLKNHAVALGHDWTVLGSGKAAGKTNFWDVSALWSGAMEHTTKKEPSTCSCALATPPSSADLPFARMKEICWLLSEMLDSTEAGSTGPGCRSTAIMLDLLWLYICMQHFNWLLCFFFLLSPTLCSPLTCCTSMEESAACYIWGNDICPSEE